MKIKTKLAIGTGMLFLLITLLSALAIRQVNLLAQDTKNILVANYISLDYARNMYKVTDAPALTQKDLATLQGYLVKQQQNITEIGEKELTDDLARHFAGLQSDPQNGVYIQNFRQGLNSIMKLNMDAIQRKSLTAEKTAESSVWWISCTSAVCFMLGFTLIFNLPGYIANPIRDLTESIRQIAAKNYAQRVYFKGHDEFTTLARSFNTMAEKLQEYSNSNLDKLLIEKKRIETLVNNLHDPVLGLDENNTILFINEKALQVSGLKRQQTIGKKAEEVALHNDLIRSLLQQADNNTNSTLKIYADDKESYFEKLLAPISIVPTGETDDRTIGSFIILRNVTAYKELDFAKTNFIATVSHEFKTPIASIKMSLQLLANEQTGKLNDEQKGLVEGINDDAERLLRTTGELLNITQVETGRSQIKMEACTANSIISNAVAATQKLADYKGIRLNIDTAPDLPLIFADKEKAAWIVSNLLSNAIRYSYENTSVTVKTLQNNDTIQVLITDTGTGIEPKYQTRIFDKYFRVPGTEKEGTGLGLAISKEFMEAQGGDINVKSTIGEGTTFTLNFTQAV
ncbi:HAMP domain-containing protein [Flavobacterium zepuense]|uniref:histidine kinase n=1 Tax=Flavobacterium zepuense TaxID=2593302 RepID=A0A552VA78_9FLAO|nr:ATP-binding protein [Flavobacterium zepuense]TRW27372.1 HAMP domain-containing protein [Flavobacterium zepuense]